MAVLGLGGSLADLCGVWAGRLYPDTKVRVHSFGAPSVSVPPPFPHDPLIPACCLHPTCSVALEWPWQCMASLPSTGSVSQLPFMQLIWAGLGILLGSPSRLQQKHLGMSFDVLKGVVSATKADLENDRNEPARTCPLQSLGHRL